MHRNKDRRYSITSSAAIRDTLWMLCRSVRQSGLAPENFTTLAHFSISKRIEIT
jgi:hypothetical protein